MAEASSRSSVSTTDTLSPTSPVMKTGAACLFVVWDDCLFPTTDLFSLQNLPMPTADGTPRLQARVKRLLEKPCQSLQAYLITAVRMSERFVILCHGRPSWVHDCVRTYLPSLLWLFRARRLDGSPAIVVHHVQLSQVPGDLPEEQQAQGSGWFSLRSSPRAPAQPPFTMEHLVKGMAASVRWPTARFQHVAVVASLKEDLAVTRPIFGDALVHLKVLRVPVGLRSVELSLRLQLETALMPAIRLIQRSFDVDTTKVKDPLVPLGCELYLPRLQNSNFPRAAWGRDTEKTPSDLTVAKELYLFRYFVSEAVLVWPRALLSPPVAEIFDCFQ